MAAAVSLLAFSGTAHAEIFKDYAPSKAVTNVTLVKVNPNRVDDYLDGLKQTWQPSCDIQKKMGDVLDCGIYLNEAKSAGPFNMILTMTFRDSAAQEPNEAKYKALEAELRKSLEDAKQKSIVKSYEDFRTFWGEGDYRRVEWKAK